MNTPTPAERVRRNRDDTADPDIAPGGIRDRAMRAVLQRGPQARMQSQPPHPLDSGVPFRTNSGAFYNDTRR
jgi:hypothetical protein